MENRLNPNGDGRDRFIKALNCQPVDRPPVWIMRQAGRTLPEYMVLRRKHTFLERMKIPELAAEITLQPMRRWGMDAAVIFADILIIPEAMGQTLSFPAGGPCLEPKLPHFTPKAIDPQRDFPYLGESLRRVRDALGDGHALLGFTGAPYTLACYMVERGSKKDFVGIKRWMFRDPEGFNLLMSQLAEAVSQTLIFQLQNGADVVQLFDTWAGQLSPEDYASHVAPHVQRIIASVQAAGGKIIYYLRNGVHLLDTALTFGADGYSLDWRVSLPDIAARLDKGLPPTVALQGNLDPVLLFADPQVIRRRVQELHKSMGGRPGHVFNLGHGLLPDLPLSGIGAFVDAVKGLG